MEKEEKKVEEKEEKKEMSKGLKIFIIVAMIILTILIFIFAFNLGRSIATLEENVVNNDDDEEKEEIELEQLTKDSAVVKKLFERFKEDQDQWDAAVMKDVNTEMDTRLFIAFKELDSTKFKKESCSKYNGFYNEEYHSYFNCGEFDESKGKIGEDTRVFKAADLESKYKEIFGLNSMYNNQDFAFGELEFAHYDKDSDSYMIYTVIGGIELEYEYTQTLESIEQNGTKLILNTKMIKHHILDDESSVSTYNVSYAFEYEKETGNYIFVSREEK